MVGVLFGLPSFRVKGFYLALVTIATQFIVIFVIYHLPKYTGGIHGMTAPAPQLGSITFNTEKSYYLLTLVAAIVMTYFAKNLTRSRAGRAFIAIRDNDLAAEVMGINIHYYKLVAFFVSTVYAGVAGSLLAHYMRLLSPDYFTLLTSVWYLAVLVIGGMGSTLGPIFGAIVMRFLFEMTDYLNSAIVILAPGVATQLVTATSMMVLGLVVTVFLIYEPRGLAHRWELFKASYRLHPFSG
jgi:branched-chain amino acid transport system permease protein